MDCWNCGAEIPDGAERCPACGADTVQMNRDEAPDRPVQAGRSGTGGAIRTVGRVAATIAVLIVLGAIAAACIQGLSGAPDPGADTPIGPDTGRVSPTTRLTPVRTPEPAPTPVRTPDPAPSPTDSTEYYDRTFEWSYGGDTWTYTTGIARETYEYYREKPHNREHDYSQYALSDYDRTYIRGIVEKFREAGRQKGYGEYDDLMMIVSFVHSLPYTSDSATTGHDEYPRYPLETLVDNGGDCEDTAILTAALIHEMGYGVVLIELSDHMAAGVKCSDDVAGTYYPYQGSRYYYLETTGQGWDIGVVPAPFEGERAIIHPLVQVPRLDLSMRAEYEDHDSSRVYYRVHCDIENIGTGTALAPVLHIAALAPGEGPDRVWDQETVELDDYGEGATGWAEATVSIPHHATSQIRCTLYGGNFEPVAITSDTFST